jgi:hypothetical protein
MNVRGLSMVAVGKGAVAAVVLVASLGACRSNLAEDQPSSEGQGKQGEEPQEFAEDSDLGVLPEGLFEGEIALSLQGRGAGAKATPALMRLKATRMRFDAELDDEGGAITQIVDGSQGMLTTLAHGPEVTLVLPMDHMNEVLAPWLLDAKGAQPARPKVRRTERQARVAGHSCRDWDYATEGGDRGSVCLSELVAGWLGVSGEATPTWAASLFDGPRFPLRFVNYDETGKEAGRLEVHRIQVKSIPDDVFDVPAGYRRVSASSLMGGEALVPPPGVPRPPFAKLPWGAAEVVAKLRGMAKD